MRAKTQSFPKPARVYIVIVVLLLLTTALILRLIDLHVINNSFLRHQGDARMVRVVNMPAYRGMLTDRNGEPLAVSAPVASIWINPAAFLASDQAVQNKALSQISRELDIPRAVLKKRITTQSQKEFLYLKRHVNPEVAYKLVKQKWPGLNVMTEFRRYYPAGEVTAHLIGLTDLDDQGREGLELGFDKQLSGQQGAKRVVKDRLGHVVEELDVLRQPQDGKDVILSIDRRLQYLVYRELKAGLAQYQAKAATAVILDVQTGEVLASVNVPSFNPNNRGDRDPAHIRNRAATDLFEPGSVLKPISMALALEEKAISKNARFDTSPGYLRVNRNVVRDIHNNGELDLVGILQKSSNVGITKVVWDIPPPKMVHFMKAMGFGQNTKSGFPGEREGVVTALRPSDRFGMATLSFGYGISITALQLANAYATIAAGGEKKPISFVKLEKPPKTERVLEAKAAAEIREMLRQVVAAPQASGWRAQVAGYTVAGKTGTVRKLEDGEYVSDKHVAIFAGFAPATAPRLVLVILVDEPKGGGYYGGVVAAPLFSRIMTGALRVSDIPPDQHLQASH